MTDMSPLPPERPVLTHRIAQEADIPAITELMRVTVAEGMREFLTPKEIEKAWETMGPDSTLIRDGTYFVVETALDGQTLMVGCGGWGKRRTLYGGDHAVNRDDSLADPAIHAARIRAMYTRPGWTRRGIGSLILRLGEQAARDAGFTSIELGSTLPGEPLYRRHGFAPFDRDVHIGPDGTKNTVIHMRKAL